jgi:hypothetical protein
MQSVGDGKFHEGMPGGVELDFVDPNAVTVVRLENGVIRIGEEAPFENLG